MGLFSSCSKKNNSPVSKDDTVTLQYTDTVIEDSVKMNIADPTVADTAAADTAAKEDLNFNVETSTRPESPKSKPLKTKIVTKRKEKTKKGFTSIRAERRKTKSRNK